MKGFAKFLSIVPAIIGIVLLFLSGTITFGADFYTEMYKGVYVCAGWICISLGIVCFVLTTFLGNDDAPAAKPAPAKHSAEVNNTTAAPVLEKKEEVKVEAKPSDEKLEELGKLKNLLDQGIISQEEYDTLKATAIK